MIDYYETKSQPITRLMVAEAYRKVKANKGSHGIDKMSWEDLEKDRKSQLYKLWNRLTSGSYFPMPLREVEIKKRSGGNRNLGIPTLLDRIAQEVVRKKLEQKVEIHFHPNSYGYRPNRSCHQAVERMMRYSFTHNWAIDMDIKGFFDTIDHKLLMKAVSYFCKEKWILMYVERWLKSGVFKKDITNQERLTGTPQGGVISPLLANIFLHFAFDKWMEREHPEKPFVRYADDIVVHCKTEKQAIYLLYLIEKRLRNCKLKLNKEKTKIVNLRGRSMKKYPRSLDFLGFTLKPWWCETSKGYRYLTTTFISTQSVKAILGKFRKMKIHKWRRSLEEVSKVLTPIIRGIKNYYCKFWYGHTIYLWMRIDEHILKWVRWEKGMRKRAALRWLKKKCRENPKLLPHWELASP